MTQKKKKYLMNFIMVVICFAMSVLLCFFVFDDIFVFISGSPIGFIVLRIFIAGILYILLKCIINKELNDKQLLFLFITYSLLVISLTLFKTHDLSTPRGYNFNPLSMFKDLNTVSGGIMSVGNAIAYIPIGVYIRKTVSKKNNVFLTLVFLVYCTSIEILQYIASWGIADIDDIILNTLGFYCGIKLFEFYKKHKKGDAL
ncbi:MULTISPECIES: VanZ family protein [Clostridium]|uniref:VanZ family protein n=1 Tax=Clostridium TaxID=1485 RepID=UPI00069E9E60|nr:MULTISPECIES: VanZ family protein [Clostridium]KOF57143.1 hypothetical protein AGR56_11555 [Clostridium sp. DMHC 10]MCD2349013.1 VanZ family protein [Clostridium guangxiense]